MPQLEEVLNELEAGFYVVPEIQRSFVWKNTQIRDLVASIYFNDPIGGIVYWKIPNEIMKDENLGGLFRPLADDLPLGNGQYLVIDGQQRLTSLLLIKRGEIEITVRGEKKKRKIKLYFNPIDERFELNVKKSAKEPWFDVKEVLNSTDIYELINKQAKNDESIRKNPKVRENLQKLQNAFKTYEIFLLSAKLKYTGDFLSTFERISRIFVNLNSKGTRIRMPDLALALLTARMRRDIGVSFRREFEKLLQETAEKGFPISEPAFIRLYSAIATGTTKFNDARKELEKKSGKDIEGYLEETTNAIKETIELLQELGIKGNRFLQSDYLVVPVAYLLYKEVLLKGLVISDLLKANLSRWLILASLEKRYTGRLETDLYMDIETINKGEGVKGLIKGLNLREIPASTLESEYENRHLTLLLLLYQRIGAQDWNFEEKPRLRKISELSTKEMHIHHIFPEEFLERRGFEEKQDYLGNITIISERANEKIKFKNPEKYLKELKNVDPELLRRHCIPMDERLWCIDSYEDFLKERIKILAETIEKEFNIKVSPLEE